MLWWKMELLLVVPLSSRWCTGVFLLVFWNRFPVCLGVEIFFSGLLTTCFQSDLHPSPRPNGLVCETLLSIVELIGTRTPRWCGTYCGTLFSCRAISPHELVTFDWWSAVSGPGSWQSSKWRRLFPWNNGVSVIYYLLRLSLIHISEPTRPY